MPLRVFLGLFRRGVRFFRRGRRRRQRRFESSSGVEASRDGGLELEGFEAFVFEEVQELERRPSGGVFAALPLFDGDSFDVEVVGEDGLAEVVLGACELDPRFFFSLCLNLWEVRLGVWLDSRGRGSLHLHV